VPIIMIVNNYDPFARGYVKTLARLQRDFWSIGQEYIRPGGDQLVGAGKCARVGRADGSRRTT
jgi:hypothetical protein